jgi:hypothetical protein
VYGRSQQCGQEQSYEEELRIRATHLRNLLSQIEEALTTRCKLRYKETRVSNTANQTLLESNLFLLSDRPIATFRSFGNGQFTQEPQDSTLYTVTWHTNVRGTVLRDVVKRSLHFCAKKPQQGVAARLEPVTIDSPLWNQGFILYTSFGQFAMPLDLFWESGGFGQFNLPNLGRLVRSFVQTRRNPATHQNLRAIIHRCAFHSGLFNLVVDVIPREGSVGRAVSFTSSYNLSNTIVDLLCGTCDQYVSGEALVEFFKQKLSLFPPVPKER